MTTGEHLLRELAPEVLRYGRPPLRRVRPPPKTPCKRRSIAAAFQWPRTGVPEKSSRVAHPRRRSKAHGSDPVGLCAPPARNEDGPRNAAGRKRGTAAPDEAPVEEDDALVLLFMCCQKLRPDSGEASGLLALMLLTDARRAARSGPNGEIIPLDEQDRSLWNKEAIAEGVQLVTHAMTRGAPGSYLLQAAIAAVHAEAARAEDTDWPQIVALYEELMRMSDNPMVALNHAVAVAMVRGPAEGIALLETLDRDPRIEDHHRLDAVRAHLLERAGRSGPPSPAMEPRPRRPRASRNAITCS